MRRPCLLLPLSPITYICYKNSRLCALARLDRGALLGVEVVVREAKGPHPVVVQRLIVSDAAVGPRDLVLLPVVVRGLVVALGVAAAPPPGGRGGHAPGEAEDGDLPAELEGGDDGKEAGGGHDGGVPPHEEAREAVDFRVGLGAVAEHRGAGAALPVGVLLEEGADVPEAGGGASGPGRVGPLAGRPHDREAVAGGRCELVDVCGGEVGVVDDPDGRAGPHVRLEAHDRGVVEPDDRLVAAVDLVAPGRVAQDPGGAHEGAGAVAGLLEAAELGVLGGAAREVHGARVRHGHGPHRQDPLHRPHGDAAGVSWGWVCHPDCDMQLLLGPRRRDPKSSRCRSSACCDEARGR